MIILGPDYGRQCPPNPFPFGQQCVTLCFLHGDRLTRLDLPRNGIIQKARLG
jgi:hypothetical protein